MRVCVFGGLSRDRLRQHFITTLSSRLITDLNAVVVTGGYLGKVGDSTDKAALDGARQAAEALNRNLTGLFEAWLPDMTKRNAGRWMGVDSTIPVREMPGRTAMGRRLAMVSGVDAVVTFGGESSTELVLEQALELAVPVLPIALTGGTSLKIYRLYTDRIESAFEPGSVGRCFSILSSLGLGDPRSIDSVLEVVKSARLGRCLILQPYEQQDDDLYMSVIKPAVEAEMMPVRLKDAAGSEQIYGSFFDAVLQSDAIIADISDLNENVMYEIGYAHGHGKRPLLFTLDPSRIASLPIYLSTLNIHTPTIDGLPDLVRNHLKLAKKSRHKHGGPAR